jgi:hypothetical protein
MPFVSVPIVPGREVTAVTLPPNGIRPGGGPASGMHIFALAVGRGHSSLNRSFPA